MVRSLLLLLFGAVSLSAQIIRQDTYKGVTFTVITVNIVKTDVSLHLLDRRGNALGSFSALRDHLKVEGYVLDFAMNAGMFHADRSAVGLHVQKGKIIHPLNLADGEGNFFLKPNGVFGIDGNTAFIETSDQYALRQTAPRLATQSGPMLIMNGKIHSAFKSNSRSKKIRNGVGLNKTGELCFVISENPVSFYQFAQYFHEHLKCDNALYLDGAVSSIFLPKLSRNDAKTRLGPILAVTRKKE